MPHPGEAHIWHYSAAASSIRLPQASGKRLQPLTTALLDWRLKTGEKEAMRIRADDVGRWNETLLQ